MKNQKNRRLGTAISRFKTTLSACHLGEQLTLNQWAWGSNPHGRTKSTMFQGASCFFVVSTPKRGHEWGFEKRGPPPIRRAKNDVARHFLARGRGPPRAHQEKARWIAKKCEHRAFLFAVYGLWKGVLIVIWSSNQKFGTADRSKMRLSRTVLHCNWYIICNITV